MRKLGGRLMAHKKTSEGTKNLNVPEKGHDMKITFHSSVLCFCY
ncbi:hypothetical protein B4120_1306 [Bacillus cereus]|nr:hypothetical protein B4120_1306 [Bacillus cereus]